MVRADVKTKLIVGLLLVCCFATIRSQDRAPASFDESGQISIDGRTTPYLIRRLPINAFPQLPSAIQDVLNRHGCLIPQTYEAHQPENVVNASLERHGSSDWAVLCSAKGTVSLLVFFASNPGEPIILASTLETERLQAHAAGNCLGFDWGIDPASPEQVHEAQLGMRHPPPRLDHDALADSIIDHATIYHFFSAGVWTLVDTED